MDFSFSFRVWDNNKVIWKECFERGNFTIREGLWNSTFQNNFSLEKKDFLLRRVHINLVAGPGRQDFFFFITPPVHTKLDVTSQRLSSPGKWQKKKSQYENHIDIHESRLRQDGADSSREINKMLCSHYHHLLKYSYILLTPSLVKMFGWCQRPSYILFRRLLL